MLAAEMNSSAVRNLVLCEPACLSLARGQPGVEAHIAALGPVFALAADPSVSAAEFSRLFAEAMGTPAPDLAPDVLETTVWRLRSTVPPWEVTVRHLVPSRVPTLVLTGGSDRMYDEVASTLAMLGAEHDVVANAGQRPQDRAEGVEIINRFWQRTTH